MRAFAVPWCAPRFGICLVLVLWLPPFESLIAAEEVRGTPPTGEAPITRSVQAISLPATSVDDPTSWIIEPDIPRIPVIPGLNAQLPRHIERRLGCAFDLAQRGASYSANAEFRAVLGLCALELDAREGNTRHREALHRAWLAVDEADDFDTDRVELRDAEDIRMVAAGHETPVLNQPSKSAESASDAIQAVRAYYAYAEEQFIHSCEGLPSASLAYYGLARTFVVPGTQTTHAAGKAVLLQRVALTIAPQNVLAGNELGVLLAEHGHLDDAERLFRRCLAISPSPETWRNLAVVYARQGNQAASRTAHETGDALAAEESRVARAAGLTQAGASEADKNVDSATAKEKQGFLAKFHLFKLQNPFRR
jgi:tetratricopeptide (TPR) repeat protein